MMDEYEKLRDIDSGIDRSLDYLYEIKNLLIEMRDLLKPTQTVSVSLPTGVSTEGASWAMEASK